MKSYFVKDDRIYAEISQIYFKLRSYNNQTIYLEVHSN